MNSFVKLLLQLGLAGLAAATVGTRAGAITPVNAPAAHGLGTIGSALWDVPNAWVREALQWFLTKGVRRVLYGPLLLLILWVCHIPGPFIAIATIYLFLVGPFRHFRRLVVGIRDPIAVTFITAIPNGWKMVRFLVMVITGAIGFGLVAGITLSFVPATNAAGVLLIPGFVLLVLATVFFLLFGAILKFELLSMAGVVAGIGAAILLVIICLGGWKSAWSKVSNLQNLGGAPELSYPVLTDETIAELTPAQPDWEVNISTTAWTGWIRTPPHTRCHLRNNGNLAIRTLSGKFYKLTQSGPLPDLPDCVFRLMGEGGKARVWID